MLAAIENLQPSPRFSHMRSKPERPCVRGNQGPSTENKKKRIVNELVNLCPHVF